MDLKTRGTLPAGPQIRSYPASFEIRALTGSKVELNGYASTFDAPYEMYDMFGAYTEIVRQGAFTKTLADGADVAYLANHEGLTMARTASGSLKLSQDTTGLLTSATVNTQRGDVRDLVTAVEDGDVDQMSFAFRVMRQEWSPDFDQRDMIELNIDRGDVSAVNFGASPSTNVGVQRAYRGHKPAELHRIAVQLRDGRALEGRAAETLADILDRMADQTDRRNTPEEPVTVDDGVLDFLKRQLELEAR